ncbi:hypothetical protein Dip510_000083 [Elusimicrobium posterum]|uniref:LA_2272 family surface repeat-containing protein n=1 Tax=Elusimicrobium posterum TaxID=3116653 RepID=UPI003C78983A
MKNPTIKIFLSFLILFSAVVFCGAQQNDGITTPVKLSLFGIEDKIDSLPAGVSTVIGLDIGIFNTKTPTVYGFQFGGLGAQTDESYGFQFATALANSKHYGIKSSFGATVGTTYGLDIAPVSAADVTGISVNLIGLYDVEGIAFSIYKKNQIYDKGIIINGFSNTHEIYGLQVGLVNYADKFSGVQIGIINSTKQLTGVQIGLWNMAYNGILPYMPIFNAAF